jgi:hypothetical protein
MTQLGTAGPLLRSKYAMTSVTPKDALDPRRSVTIDGEKFLWDGRFFKSCDDASCQAEEYMHDNFEVRMVEVSGTYLIYTRRVVKEITATAP